MKRISFINFVLFFVFIQEVFSADLDHVVVYWTANGSSKSATISAGNDYNLERDKGSAINIRIYKNSSAPSTCTFSIAGFPTVSYERISTNTSEYFSNVGDALTNAIWCMVNTTAGIVRIYPTDLPSGTPDVSPINREVNGSTSSSGKVFLVGQNVDVECDIWNNGDADAGSHRTGFYIGTSSSDYSDRFAYNTTGSNPIRPGYAEHETEDYTFTSDDVGTRYINFFADYRDDIEEGSAEGNNKQSWGPFTVREPIPAISVSPSSLDFGTINMGSYSDKTFVVTNTGDDGLSGTATVSAPFSIVSGGTYSNLDHNESQNVVVRFQPTSAGTFNKTVTFTGGGGSTKNVSGSGAGVPQADITQIYYQSTQVDPGEAFALNIKLKNIGNDIATSGGISVTFPNLTKENSWVSETGYSSSQANVLPMTPETTLPNLHAYDNGDEIFDKNKNPITSGYLLYEATKDNWAVNEENLLVLVLTPKIPGPFTVQLRGWLNYGDGDVSTDPSSTGTGISTDQQGYYDYEQIVTVNNALPDLIISSASTPSTVVLGETYQISFAVKNNGDLASGLFSNEVRISTDTEFSNGELLKTQNISNLDPDETFDTGDFNITIPSSGYSGDCYFIVKADPTNLVNEGNDDNNVIIKPVTVIDETFNLSGFAKSNLNNYDVIPDAIVQIDDDQDLTAITSWDGSYTIENIPSGSHNVSISHDGYSWEQTLFTINFNSDKTQDFLGHCKATPDVTYDIPFSFVPGEPFEITVTLKNTNYAISDVPAYLDVSFPDFTETTTDVLIVSQSGFDSNPQLYQPGAEICQVNTTSGEADCTYPADWLLVNGERNAAINFNSPWSYTLSITPPDIADFRIQIKGSIGDQRWPDDGVDGQQGYLEKEIVLNKSSQIPAEWGNPTAEHNINIYNNNYLIKEYQDGKYTIIYQVDSNIEILIEDVELAKSIINYYYLKNEYLNSYINGIDGLYSNLTTDEEFYSDYRNRFRNKLYRIRVGNAAFSAAEVMLKLKTGTLSWTDLTILKDYIINNWSMVYNNDDINTLQHLMKAYSYIGKNKDILGDIAFNNNLNLGNNVFNFIVKLKGIEKSFIELDELYSSVDYNDLTSILLSNQKIGLKLDEITTDFAIDAGKIAIQKLLINDVGRESLVLTQSVGWHADAISEIDIMLMGHIQDFNSAIENNTDQSNNVNELINQILIEDVFILQPLRWELWQSYAFHLNNIKENAPLVYGYISADYFWWLGGEDSHINYCLENAEMYKTYSRLSQYKDYSINSNMTYGSWKYSIGLINANKINNLFINKDNFEPIVLNYNESNSINIPFKNFGSYNINSIQVSVENNDLVDCSLNSTFTNLDPSQEKNVTLALTALQPVDQNQIARSTAISINLTWIENDTPISKSFTIPIQILSSFNEFSIETNKEIFFSGDIVNIKFDVNPLNTLTVDPTVVANDITEFNLESFEVSGENQINWVIPEDSPKGTYGFVFDGYIGNNKVINKFKIDDAFIVLPNITGNLEDFDFSSVTIISPENDSEIALQLQAAIKNSQILYTDGLTAGELLPAMQEDNLILVGGDQTGDLASNLVKYLVDNGKVESGLWTQPGDANVITIDDPFVPVAPYGNKAIVVAGYTLEDTYISGLRLLYELDKPQMPEVLPATNVGQAAFTANWNTADHATGYYLDVALDDSFTSFVSGYDNKDVGTNTSDVVSGLTANTNYYYRVRSYNQSSVSDYSNTITQKTLAENAVLTYITIEGIPEINENDSYVFSCYGHYNDGTREKLTTDVSWECNSNYASINQSGELTTSEVITNEVIIIKASYRSLNVSYNVSVLNIIETPIDRQVSSKTLLSGISECFDAQNDIFVAGDGSTVEIKNGASVNFIAGQSVTFLPGFHAEAGSYVDAHITTDGSFCDQLPQAIVAVSDSDPIAPQKSEPVEEGLNIDAKAQIKVYPNPNNGSFTVELDHYYYPAKLVLYDSSGKIVVSCDLLGKSTAIDLPKIKNGIYLMQVFDQNQRCAQKLIINQ